MVTPECKIYQYFYFFNYFFLKPFYLSCAKNNLLLIQIHFNTNTLSLIYNHLKIQNEKFVFL